MSDSLTDELEGSSGFRLAVGDFDGPFDLLLSLIAKHELDITEVALSVVTDEFIKYLKSLDPMEELDQATEFLVVAATLLDLKVAGLLPQGELVDAEDAAMFEARDLLFARLLQYRAFKDVALWFSEHLEAESTRHARTVRLEDKYRSKVPELIWHTSLDDFAAIAMLAMLSSRWRRSRAEDFKSGEFMSIVGRRFMGDQMANCQLDREGGAASGR